MHPSPARPVLLLVDDDPDYTFFLQSMLKKVEAAREYDVRFARSQEEVETLLKTVAPAVVVSDLRLPGGSGLDVLAAARARSPRAVLILLSGIPGQFKESEPGWARFAHDVWDKGWPLPQMRERFQELLRRSRSTGPASALP